jgi:hypothetical protein
MWHSSALILFYTAGVIVSEFRKKPSAKVCLSRLRWGFPEKPARWLPPVTVNSDDQLTCISDAASFYKAAAKYLLWIQYSSVPRIPKERDELACQAQKWQSSSVTLLEIVRDHWCFADIARPQPVSAANFSISAGTGRPQPVSSLRRQPRRWTALTEYPSDRLPRNSARIRILGSRHRPSVLPIVRVVVLHRSDAY